MSIFTETMTKAISDYRYLLRRSLDQVDRIQKLRDLGLKNPELYDNELSLFQAGQAIIQDIENKMIHRRTKKGYYVYSGIVQFCEYLKEYLANYEIENDRVVHRAQKASRALIQSIQLTTVSKEYLTDKIANQLIECNKIVVKFGSPEQWALQVHTLERQHRQNPGFYTHIIAHFRSLVSGKTEARTAA